jgi:hypothetical protein
VYLQLLNETNVDVLHTLGVHPICNQFWQYPLCNLYRLWQPDELHQLLLGLVKDLWHWLLKYLKVRNLKDPHQCHDIPASSTSIHDSILSQAARGKVKRSVE